VQQPNQEVGPSFGALLQRFRKTAGLTQEQLAERSNLSRRGIADLERGARQAPHVHTLEQLRTSLELSEPDYALLVAVARPRPEAPVPRSWTRRRDVSGPLSRHGRTAPLQPGRLIGRERDLATLRNWLLDADTRLITVTGAGGCGKTRLALAACDEVGRHFSDGTVFVDLAVLRDAALVPAAIADALDVQDVGSGPLLDAIIRLLRDRELLLVLDNFEHVLSAATVALGLLESCPRLRVLATSREPLRLRWEQRFPLEPLDVAESNGAVFPEQIETSPSCRLFVERARLVHPAFVVSPTNASAIREICARLDGLPLAIELAAAQTAVLSPTALLVRLAHRLELHGNEPDRPERHRRLRDAIAWSYELLSHDEQRLFRALAVFAGQASLDAIRAVSGEDTPTDTIVERLTALVEKGLLQVSASADGEPRFRMLETVREFASEQLSAVGESADYLHRHARFYAELMTRPETIWFSPEIAAWADQIEAELPNLRAALSWSLQSQHDPTPGLQIMSFPYYWDTRGHIGEARTWLSRMLAAPSVNLQTPERARCLASAAFLALMCGDHDAALAYVQEAVTLARATGDVSATWMSLMCLGHTLRHVDASAAEPSLRESYEFARDSDYAVGMIASAWMLAECNRAAGDLAAARMLFDECLATGELRGLPAMASYAQRGLGHLDWMVGDYDRAETHLGESLRLHARVRHARGLADVVEAMAWNAASSGNFERAARLLGAACGQRERLGIGLQGGHLEPHERAMDIARIRLGATAFDAAFGAGVVACASVPEWALQSLDEKKQSLTRREREVARLVAQEYPNRHIAEALVITERTVETHVTNILGKLRLRSRVQVRDWATNNGLMK
jgi:non-specific serine/threonine protein kinase